MKLVITRMKRTHNSFHHVPNYDKHYEQIINDVMGYDVEDGILYIRCKGGVKIMVPMSYPVIEVREVL